MNQLNEHDLAQHVTILGWLLIVAHVIFFVIGAFIFLLLTGVGVVSGDRQAFAVLGIVGTFVGGLLAVIGIPGILAGVGLLRRKNWGRILAIIVAILGLPNFPLGTALSVYALWVLLQQSASAYFASSPAQAP
jgi:hypothetical protein